MLGFGRRRYHREAEGRHHVRHYVSMAAQDPIWSCARDDLVVTDDQGHADVFVWEHATRVARSLEWIVAQQDVPQHRVDQAALTAAALYHDAGWAVQLREGAVSHSQLLCKAASDLQRNLAANLMERQLGKLLSAGALQRAAECVRLLRRRDSELPEAQILNDADNLDHIGPVLFCQITQRQGWEGRGVESAIATWQARKDYHFWDAWIDEFRFESIRKLARQRLEEHDRSVAALARQHRGEDLISPAASVDAHEPTDRPPRS